MNFDLSDEQKMLAEQARALLSEHSSYERLRQLIDAGAEWDEPLWRRMADLGFLGAAIPEEFGGLGLSDLDQGVIAAELGRANAATPFFSSIVLAANAVRAAGSEAQKSKWLPAIASGDVVATMSYPGSAIPGVLLKGGKLSGQIAPIADAGVASVAIVGTNQTLALVELDQPGVTREKLESFDHLRPHYALTFDGAKAELLDANAAQIAAIYDRAAVQAAFEAVGGAEACLYMARDYAAERRIFGRPLSSYQAIKHKLADILLAVEFAKSNAYFAAWAADDAPDDLPLAAAASRLSASAAFEQAARENLQVHGGIGYTFEANCHFYYRRERTLALALGGRQAWADRLIAHVPGLR